MNVIISIFADWDLISCYKKQYTVTRINVGYIFGKTSAYYFYVRSSLDIYYYYIYYRLKNYSYRHFTIYVPIPGISTKRLSLFLLTKSVYVFARNK